MSKAALNMATRLLFNDLHPQGYTFRVYHPGWIRGYMGGEKNLRANLEPEEAAVPALTYFLQARDDEGELAMYDWQGDRWPW
jgi:NAD(P)-dependent dehydrogenase (short-subunit alcohol dehydrogenase family)